MTGRTPLPRSLAHIWRIVRDNSLLMMSGAVAALVWANLAPESYEHLTHPLHFVVNDIAMVFFFGLATKEIIGATAPGGPLHSVRRAALPALAAVGGMVGPAAVYLLLATLSGRTDILRGWAIPCATDIAFSYLVAKVIFSPMHPAVPFLLLLAIVDDALGLVLLAVAYPSGDVQPLYLVGLLPLACLVAWGMRRGGVRSFWPYVLGPGVLSWLGFYIGGLHPALALVPVLPFLPRGGQAGEAPDPAGQAHGSHSALDDFEHWWKVPVEFILFFFALSNAGVPLGGAGATTAIVVGALLVGKPLGITVSAWLAERGGLERPDGLHWGDVAVLGTVAGIGFTVALFFATAAFEPGPNLNQAKLGALMSVSASLLAIGAARLLGTGKFAR